MASGSEVWVSPTTLTVALVTIIVCFATSTLLSYRKLQHIPGPPLAAFSQLWFARVTAKGDCYKTTKRVLEQYGSPARIGPNMIIYSDPELYRAVSAPRSPFRRGNWYKGMQLDPRLNNLLSERDEKRHSELRSKMLPAYTGKEVPELEVMIDERVLDLVGLMQRIGIDEGQMVDFGKVAQYFTLDSLTHIAFGQPVGFLIKNEDLFEYNESTSAFYPILEMGANVPWIGDLLKSRLMSFLAGPKAGDKAGLGAIMGWARDRVSDRFAAKQPKESHRSDMLDSFIRHGLTQLEAESEATLQILAGSDSTATTIRMSICFLLTNPAVYIKLRKEVDTAVRAGKISSPIVKNSEATTLPYLSAIIKETLRVWQPLNGIATKVAPPEGITVNGVWIPGGTQLAVHIQAITTRKDVFGPDADIFRPERWLESSPETLKSYEKVLELTFASGRFTCPGKGIALMESHKIVFEIMRRFDLGLVNPVNTLYSRCHQLFIQKDMYLRVSAHTDG